MYGLGGQGVVSFFPANTLYRAFQLLPCREQYPGNSRRAAGPKLQPHFS